LWEAVTTDLAYVRLHGHTRKYASSYSAASLARWADRVRRWAAAGHAVHVYLDNDAEGAAITNARALSARLGIAPASAESFPLPAVRRPSSGGLKRRVRSAKPSGANFAGRR
jgi:uncharacterized protein YecE (DUF72 family)